MVRQLPHSRSSPASPLPPLESGDRLTRPEFERRYAAALRIKKAELIEGIVYVASPLRFTPHAEPHSRLYIVWQAFENRLDWFQLVEGEYRSLYPDADGMIRSQRFPGLWLAVEALLSNQMTRVLSGLQEGINSPDHAAFLTKLG
ncbi:hypothetical protein [Egbenema bharatensis]|uniref:hypothetical protein n=1 Tax=Egbenema bharatensis TaxID=3463334 RepID=UPI003A8A99B1